MTDTNDDHALYERLVASAAASAEDKMTLHQIMLDGPSAGRTALLVAYEVSFAKLSG